MSIIPIITLFVNIHLFSFNINGNSNDRSGYISARLPIINNEKIFRKRKKPQRRLQTKATFPPTFLTKINNHHPHIRLQNILQYPLPETANPPLPSPDASLLLHLRHLIQLSQHPMEIIHLAYQQQLL
jgi:hypothetical protein